MVKSCRILTPINLSSKGGSHLKDPCQGINYHVQGKIVFSLQGRT